MLILKENFKIFLKNATLCHLKSLKIIILQNLNQILRQILIKKRSEFLGSNLKTPQVAMTQKLMKIRNI